MDTMTATVELPEEEDLEVSAPIQMGDDDPPELMTVAQTTDQLRNAEDQRHEATFELRAARMAFTNIVNQATTDATRAALEAEQRPILDRHEADLARLADQMAQRAHAVIQESEAAPPSLSTNDLAKANELRPFVIEDCERLSLATLRANLRHAIATNDTATLFLYSREIPRRIDHERSQPGFAPESIGDLDALAREAGQRLPRDRSLAPLQERATKLLHRSQDLRRDADRRASEAEARAAVERAIPGAVTIPEDA